MTTALAGRGILVTRPAAQAERSIAALRDAGATVFELPLLRLEARESADLDSVLMKYPSAAIAIFVSANAVHFGLNALAAHGISPGGPTVAAIGGATRAALAARGVDATIFPVHGQDSEGLLQHPRLQELQDRLVMLFRGESESGGRRLLADTLTARGARVLEAICYNRAPAPVDASQRAQVLQALQSGRLDVIQVMSVESLQALVAALPQNGALLQCRLVVPHPRVAAAASAFGFVRVQVADLGDDVIVNALAAALSAVQ